jgi:erythromycin esterase-like protein
MRPLVLPLLLALACSASQPSEPVDLRPHPLTGAATDYDPLLQAIGNAHLVLLGEATHGTHEFYVERMRITQRLVAEKRFTAVALEARWTDAARVDRYVKGQSTDRSAAEALGEFEEFPRWTWRNEEFAALVEWLRQYNAALPADAIEVGVYGLDLYGLEESRQAVQRHLQAVDRAFAAEVQKLRPVRQVERIRARAAQTTDKRTLDELFSAEQNARVVQNGEEYSRELGRGRVSTWNLRGGHMVVTMDALQRYLLRRNGHDHIVVWAHNSHVGDARAATRARSGEWSMGQLVREHWPRGASFTVGFMTNTGTVIAADEWGGEPRVHQLRPSVRGSHGAIFHEVGLPRFLLLLREINARVVRTPRQQRAVGVTYLPQHELQSHYFTATLREQFDAVIHIDQTKALTPL